MPLTNAQDLLVKAEIDADAILSALPRDGEGLQTVADALNAIDTPEFLVWRTNVAAQEIYNAIDWDKYTPVDTPSSSDAALASLQANRATHIRLKQENLQTMLLIQTAINASLVGIRKTLRDSCIQIPAGTGGANVSSSGANAATVLGVCRRPARRVERVLAKASAPSDTTGTTAASVMGFEGVLTSNDIDRIRGLP